MLEDMEYMGPGRAREVQEVQSKIVSVIRTLEQNGELVIVRDGPGDELLESN